MKKSLLFTSLSLCVYTLDFGLTLYLNLIPLCEAEVSCYLSEDVAN